MPKYRWLGTGHQEPVELTMSEDQMRLFQAAGNQFEGIDGDVEAEKPTPQEMNDAGNEPASKKK